jgi:hypothetical protein
VPELGDRQVLGLVAGIVLGFYLGSTVPGGMIAMSLAFVSFLAWLKALSLDSTWDRQCQKK